MMRRLLKLRLLQERPLLRLLRLEMMLLLSLEMLLLLLLLLGMLLLLWDVV